MHRQIGRSGIVGSATAAGTMYLALDGMHGLPGTVRVSVGLLSTVRKPFHQPTCL